MKTLDQINLSDRDRRAIEAAAKLLREKFPVEQVILFGSKARGDDDAESDIDLLVLTSKEMTWHERSEMSDAVFPIQLETGVCISEVIVPRQEWEHGVYQVLPLRDEIDRDGVAA